MTDMLLLENELVPNTNAVNTILQLFYGTPSLKLLVSKYVGFSAFIRSVNVSFAGGLGVL